MTTCKNKDLTLSVLLKAIQQAPSADNSQPWHCFWDGKALFLVYDSSRVDGAVFGPESQATLLAMGGVIEHIKQAAESIAVSLSIDFSQETYRGAHCYCRITFDKKEKVMADADMTGFPVFKRHTNRLGFKSSPIPLDIINKINQESEQSAQASLFDNQNSIKKIAAFVFEASKVRFQTKALHEWLSGSLRFGDRNETTGDGLDINTIDLPPGGKLFMRFISPWPRMSFLNRFGVYQIMAKIDSVPIERAPAVVAVTAPSTHQGAIEAGQLISRIWIYLNEQGVAVHPYYVISDQLQRYEENLVPDHLVPKVGRLWEKVRTFFDLSGEETVQILLRIGYPEKEPVHSKRLPLEVIFTDVSSD